MSIPIRTAKRSLGFLLVALFLVHASHATTSVPCGGTTGTPCQGPVIASWFGATCGSSQMNLTMLHQGSTAGRCVDAGFSGFERFSCDPNGLYVVEHWKDKNNTNCQGTPSYVSRITVGDCVDDLKAFTSFSYFCSVAGSASPTKKRRSPPTLPSLDYDATCADVDVCIGAQVWRTSFKDSRCSQVNATSSSLLLPPTIRLNQCYLGTTTLPTISTLYVTCDAQYIYSVNFISDACSGNPLVTNAQPHSICITDQWGESYIDHCIVPPPGIDGTAPTGLVEPINDAAVISFSILGHVAIAAFLLVF